MKKILPLLLIIPFTLLLAEHSWGQIISQYIETDSGTSPKGIEIWNNTESTLDFATNNLVIEKGANGAEPKTDFTLSSGTLTSGDVIVIGTSNLQNTTEANGSVFYLEGFTFNGDDALVVKYGSTTTDVFGDPGTGDPGNGWSGGSVQTYDQNISLVSGITDGDTDGWTDPSIRFETTSTTPSSDDSGFGIAPAGTGILPTLTSSVATDLNEGNLDGSTLTLELTNETFTASLATSYFTLNNAPIGTSTSSVSRISDTEATLTLFYDLTDFDVDISDFNVTVNAIAVSGTDPITSNNLTITAFSTPYAVTNGASDIAITSATLNGTVNAMGYETIVTFEYGTSISYGATVIADENPLPSDASSASASKSITGLTTGTEYHYRVIATNAEGTTEGADQAFTPIEAPTLIITEVTHPSDAASAKFVEIYNYGTASIDLSSDLIFLVRQTNGGTLGSIALIGTLEPGANYVIAYSENYFLEKFAKSANLYSGSVSGNGDDGYFLYAGGDHKTGTLFDAYGIIDEDGSSKDWEYSNSKAVRKTTVTTSNSTWTASEWNITEATTERMSPGLYPASVWNGSVDNNWTESGNWDNGPITSTMDAVIWGGATNFPDLSTPTTINNLLFNHNAQLNGQENLMVDGTFIILHQITESTSNTDLDHWQYFTTPFANTTSANLLSANDKVDLWALGYDNNISDTVNNAWSTIETTETSISAGIGYAMTFVNDETETGNTISGSNYNMSFTGTLVDASSSTTAPLSYQGSETTDNNWNFIGNPYLASINWFDNTNLDYSKIQGMAAYIYDPTAGNYITITSNNDGSGSITGTGSQYIPPMQGFFVDASSSGTFEIDKDARTNESYNFYKSATIPSIVRIQVEHDSLFDETVVIYNPEASTSFDCYDAHKLLANSPCPQIYTKTTNHHKLVFNQTNSLSDSLFIDVVTKSAGEYKISLSEASGDFDDGLFLLEDTQNNQLSYLKDKNYTFTAMEGINTYHFNLYLQNKTEHSQFDLLKIKAYVQNGNIVVSYDSPINGMIKVYDTMGRIIKRSHTTGLSTLIGMNEYKGIYIVHVENNTNQLTKKVILH